MRNAWRAAREVLRGAGITARHFFVNMVLHTLRLLGVRTERRGAVTIQYPEERKPLSSRHRSLHRLRPGPDGKPSCVACMLCVTVCPSEARPTMFPPGSMVKVAVFVGTDISGWSRSPLDVTI